MTSVYNQEPTPDDQQIGKKSNFIELMKVPGKFDDLMLHPSAIAIEQAQVQVNDAVKALSIAADKLNRAMPTGADAYVRQAMRICPNLEFWFDLKRPPSYGRRDA